MANFNVSFQIKGIGVISLPVTPLDSLLQELDGLSTAVFRFSVLNDQTRDITFNVVAIPTGDASSKVGIVIDLPFVTIPQGQSQVISASIIPSAPLLEGDAISVQITGTEVA